MIYLNIKEAILVLVPLFTLIFIIQGLNNWQKDKSIQLYGDLQKAKAVFLNELKKIDADANTDADADKNDAMDEFLGSLEVISIMYYNNTVNKKLFKELFLPMFQEMRKRDDVKEIIIRSRLNYETAYENFEKICRKYKI